MLAPFVRVDVVLSMHECFENVKHLLFATVEKKLTPCLKAASLNLIPHALYTPDSPSTFSDSRHNGIRSMLLSFRIVGRCIESRVLGLAVSASTSCYSRIASSYPKITQTVLSMSREKSGHLRLDFREWFTRRPVEPDIFA